MAEHPNDKRMELTEHLQELRSRIMRSIFYLIVGAVVAYFFFAPIYGFLQRPLTTEMQRLNDIRVHRELERMQKEGVTSGHDIYILPAPLLPGETVTAEKFNELRNAIDWIHRHPVSVPALGNVFSGFHEMFLVQLKVSLLVGFIMVIPLIIWELALFVTPALTPQERRPLRMLIPLSIFLLLSGMTVAYFTLFFAMNWFLSFLDAFPAGATLLQNPNEYVMFFLKMMAAFGLAFQLPVVLMGGAYLGLINSKSLAKNWRWGIVLAALGGLLTPSNDLPSMLLMAIPLLILYFGSILLVKIVENIKAKDKPTGT